MPDFQNVVRTEAAGRAQRPLYGVVERGDFDDVEATHQLLGLRERTIDDIAFAVRNSNPRALRRRIQTLRRDQHTRRVHLFVEAHVGLEQLGIELRRWVGWRARCIGLRRDDESHRLFSIQSGVGMGTTNGGAADRQGSPSAPTASQFNKLVASEEGIDALC